MYFQIPGAKYVAQTLKFLFIYLFSFANYRAGSPQQHMPITVGPFT
jgi:hypothetical protein